MLEPPMPIKCTYLIFSESKRFEQLIKRKHSFVILLYILLNSIKESSLHYKLLPIEFPDIKIIPYFLPNVKGIKLSAHRKNI